MGPSTKKLQQLESKYVRASRLAFDPLHLLDRDLPPEDQELVAFLLSGLAYGRVEQIQKSAHDLLRRLELIGCGPTGKGIRNLLREKTNQAAIAHSIKGWKHRLNTDTDLECLFSLLASALSANPSLKSVMQKHAMLPAEQRIVAFTSELNQHSPAESPKRRGKKWPGTGPKWFFASPADGSSCKRLMLYFRWMVRKNEVDPGTWKQLDPQLPALSESELFIPLDTHIFNWARKHRITQYKAPSWRAVVEISDFFRKKDPSDPLRYDFAIFQESFSQIRTRSPNRRGADHS